MLSSRAKHVLQVEQAKSPTQPDHPPYGHSAASPASLGQPHPVLHADPQAVTSLSDVNPGRALLELATNLLLLTGATPSNARSWNLSASVRIRHDGHRSQPSSLPFKGPFEDLSQGGLNVVSSGLVPSRPAWC